MFRYLIVGCGTLLVMEVVGVRVLGGGGDGEQVVA